MEASILLGNKLCNSSSNSVLGSFHILCSVFPQLLLAQLPWATAEATLYLSIVLLVIALDCQWFPSIFQHHNVAAQLPPFWTAFPFIALVRQLHYTSPFFRNPFLADWLVNTNSSEQSYPLIGTFFPVCLSGIGSLNLIAPCK